MAASQMSAGQIIRVEAVSTNHFVGQMSIGQMFFGQKSHNVRKCEKMSLKEQAGNTEGGNITVPFTSCLTVLELAV
jgi:hypothetical protein